MTATPHDSLFKTVFRQTEHAAAELRHILPEPLGRAIDWSSLSLCSSEHVDPELEQSRGDLLFSATVAGRPGHVLLLLEHQSTNDARMPLRLAEYMHRLWQRHWDEHPKNPLPLPVIIPAVLAQAHPGWTAPCRFHDLFEVTPELAPFVPHFSYALDDLAGTSDDELLARPLGALPRSALWLMRNVRTPRAVLERLPQWREPLAQVLSAPNGADGFAGLLRYVSLVMEELQFEEFRDKLVALIPSSETYVMTIAQQLEARGIAKGRDQGVAEGLKAALLAVLEARGLPISAKHRAHIAACDDPATLDQWVRAAATTESADELFHE